MIEELYIENFAIIEKTHISFKKGVNIFTGETGAGKSIIIEALELVLGSRADKDFIGIYSDRSVVEASIRIDDQLRSDIYDKYGIECDKDIIITREIFKNGSSISRLNSRRVSLKIISEIMYKIINIHGQNENQTMIDKANYLRIIDSFSDENKLKVEKLGILFGEIRYIRTKIKDLNIDAEELEREVDLLKYQINEIESASLDKLDEQALQDEYLKLVNANDIIKSLSKISDYYSSSEFDRDDIRSLMEKTLGELNKAKRYDANLETLYDQYQAITYSIQALNEEIEINLGKIELSEDRIAEIDDRFKLINDLKRKYGPSLEDVNSFLQSAKKRLEEFESKDKILHDFDVKIKGLQSHVIEIADELSESRIKISKKIKKLVAKELEKLNFPNSQFEIQVTPKKKVDKEGQDEIDFLVSFNLGQDLKSLSKVGSGGEISRFMLALKIVMADYDKVDTLIFDEIDSGISGITAAKVGSALKNLGKKYQIILITHLSQIAVLADHHILIDKYTEDGLTKSRLKEMDNDTRVYEIARLLGGDNITDFTIAAAKEQIENQK